MDSFDDLYNVLRKEMSRHRMEYQLCRKQQDLIELEIDQKSKLYVYADKMNSVRFELIIGEKREEIFRDLSYPAAADLLLIFMNSENVLKTIRQHKKSINRIRWIMFFIVWVLFFFFLLFFLRFGLSQITGQEEWEDWVTGVMIVGTLILSGAASAALSILLSNPYRDLDAPLHVGWRIAGYIAGGLLFFGGCMGAFDIWGMHKPNLPLLWNLVLASCVSVPLLGGINVILFMVKRRGDQKEKNEKAKRSD